MYKTDSQLNRKIKETEKLQLITNSMHLHALLRVDKLIKAIADAENMLADLNNIAGNIFLNPKMDTRLHIKEDGKKLVLIFGSSKGFCGDYNKQLAEKAREISDAETEFYVYGTKVPVSDLDVIGVEKEYESYSESEEARYDMTRRIWNVCLSGEYRSVGFIYSEYVNATTYKAKHVTIIPYENSEHILEENTYYHDFKLDADDSRELVEHLYRSIIFNSLSLVILNSLTTENLQRHSITKAAKDNLEDKMEELKINKFRLRSEKVTGETNDLNNAILLKKRRKK